jgi:hypothetical protein
MDALFLIWLEFIVLLAGTTYAWYNWYLVLKGECKTCSVGVHENPFTSKCFWGALFFTLALAINATLLMIW